MNSKVEQLHARAVSLIAKSKQGRRTDYIDEAIVLDREAVELCPSGHPKRVGSLMLLAEHLWDRYNILGEVVDLDEATVLDREVLALRPPGHPDRSMLLTNLAFDLCTRYKQLGEMEDLEEAVVLDREALMLHPPGHPARSISLNNLAVRLATRYSQVGEMKDLEEATALDRDALALRPPGHPHRSTSLNNLANRLFTRYSQFGAIEDLEESIALDREALVLRPPGHPDRAMSLDNHASRLSFRYNHLGAVEDLDAAIVLTREALMLRPPGNPDRPASLNNLALHLSTRHKHLGIMVDLEEAISLDRDALALRPPGHPDRSMSFNNLALRLSARYHQVGKLEDLEQAISLSRDVLALRPPRHPDRSLSLNNLATCLFARYRKLSTAEDLEEAIALNRDTLLLHSMGHPDRSGSLSNLAVCLFSRYNQLGALEDLQEAIDLDREALALRQPGHPHWSKSLSNLALYLSTRDHQLGEMGDQEERFRLYTELAHVQQTVSSFDLLAANAWVNAAEDHNHPTKLLTYETSLRFLVQHLVTLPSLPQHLDILKNITSSLAVDAFSACLCSHSPNIAVELLEQGRGVFWNQLARLRSPLEDVIASGPEGKTLADKFAQLTAFIRSALHSPGADQHDRVWHLNVELQRVMTDIRALPGFSRFLLPALFSDLQQAAYEGPVIVVNASKHSCDALVVLVDRGPVHIPLSITSQGVQELSSTLRTLTVRAKMMSVTKQFALVLRELWDKVVSHIVDFLRTVYPRGSRIWWCPTAEFSLLPLHAAGPYRKGQRNFADFYVSSYTPTLSSLIRARRRDPANSGITGKHFIAVGQAKASGQNELPSVCTELDIVGQCTEGHATFTRIEGPESCISRVAEELSKNEWVHLACHGFPNEEQPLESAFALHDGHLTIERIVGCELDNPEFAFLSACHTTVVHDHSPGEVIHLAYAMHFAGFRSVIGITCEVDDGETNKVRLCFMAIR